MCYALVQNIYTNNKIHTYFLSKIQQKWNKYCFVQNYFRIHFRNMLIYVRMSYTFVFIYL